MKAQKLIEEEKSKGAKDVHRLLLEKGTNWGEGGLFLFRLNGKGKLCSIRVIGHLNCQELERMRKMEGNLPVGKRVLTVQNYYRRPISLPLLPITPSSLRII